MSDLSLTELRALRAQAFGLIGESTALDGQLSEVHRQIHERLVTVGQLMDPDDAAAGEPYIPSIPDVEAYVLELEATVQGKATELKERADALAAELAKHQTSESPS